MPRQRLGVALLIPGRAGVEVDVLRRAVGADDLERLPPHLTLVPPVNVRDDDMDAAVDLLLDAAARTRPFRIELGPPATFLPINPVLYLDVRGDVAAVDALRDRIFRSPLERPVTWPFQPHVTLLDQGTPERIRAAMDALADWRTEVVFERVHLLREERDDDGVRVWRPTVEASFGAPAVVGRGGLELELEVTERPWAAPTDDRRPIAVTASRVGRVVGTAEGAVRPTGEAVLRRLEVVPDARGEGIGSHVLAAFTAAAVERGASYVTVRIDASGTGETFYRRHGFEPWVDPDVAQLRRDL